MPRINFFVFTIALSFILFYPSCNGNGESSIEARVTFRVDMGNEIVSNNGVHIAGTMESPNGSICLLYTSPSPRDGLLSRMPSSA